MNHLIEQALLEQNPHWGAKRYDHLFQRSHEKTVLSDLDLDEIQIITGIRRSGKSTLLQTVINHLIKSHHEKSILYINLDDPNYTEICNNPSHFYNLVTIAEKITTQRIDFLFLDEVQNVIGWEKYVKSVYDSKRFKKIFVTGSNADLLGSNYATLLSGRYIETHIYPLAFHEVLLNKDITDYYQLTKRKSEILALQDVMLNFGGFPRINTLEKITERRRVLKSYYETILLKDCIANHHVRDVKSIINLAHYLINQVSTLYSYNSLGKALGNNETTIQNFIQILQDAYLIEELRNFSFSLKTQTKSKKKIYCIDNGLMTATTFKFSNNYGKLLENLVYSELKKKYERNIYFYNDGIECDFIVYDHSRIAIQVCYQLNAENRDREKKGLATAMKEFSINQGLIITYDQEETFDGNIQAIPFWKWSAGLSILDADHF